MPKALKLLLTIAFASAGWLGIFIGVSPSAHVAAVNFVGRGTSVAPAPVPWLDLIVLSVVYVALFLCFFMSLKGSSEPRTRSVSSYWIFGLLFVVLLVIWWPFRQSNFVVLVDETTTVVWGQSGSPTTYLGEDAARMKSRHSGRDEMRDATGVHSLANQGIGEFWERGKSSWLLQHPPLAYFIWAPLDGNPPLLRALSLALFFASIVSLSLWAQSLGGPRMMLLAAFLLVSAPGLLQDLILRANLDVMVLLPGCLLGYLLFGRSESLTGKRIIAALSVLCAMMMIKFTTIILLPGLVVSKLRELRAKALLFGIVPFVLFTSYHAFLVSTGVPFDHTYLGDLLSRLMGEGEPRRFQHGGHQRSLTTLLVFTLSPIGALIWVSGFLAAVRHSLTPESGEERPSTNNWWLRPTLWVAILLLAVIYTFHPLLRYSTPGLWAIVLVTAYGLNQLSQRIPIALAAVAAASAYSLTKLVGESWF